MLKSDGGTKRELPDVVAGAKGMTYATEAKARREEPIYLNGRNVKGLVYFARKFSAKPRLGIRYDYEDWYFFHPADLHVTNDDYYRITRDTAITDGVSITGFIDKHDIVFIPGFDD